MAVIDADGHVLEPETMWRERLAPELHPRAPRLVQDDRGRWRPFVGGRLQPPMPFARHWELREGGWDPKARLADMDLDGIDVSVIFPTTGLHFAALDDAALTSALCRAYNDWLAEYCAAAPDRLVGVALVPQADVAAAVAEARRAVGELGFRGVMVRPNPVAGRNLHDPYYEPLWSALEELDVPLAVHEGTTQNVVQSGRDRFDNFAFRHACSHPHEQQFACLSLLCGGVLERHPSLRVLFLESGCGWLPYWLERLDEHMETWSFVTAGLPLTPTEYFLRQCFISCEPDERMLPCVVEALGDDVVVFASDYPHPDAPFPGAVAALRDRTDLPGATKDKILGDNAARCFALG